MTEASPKLSVKLSLAPTTYHFSNPDAPELSLTIESRAESPITLFTWGTPFVPRMALVQQGFVLTSINSNAEVAQTSIMIQRLPMSRARGSGDEQYFLTLLPHTPITVATKFHGGTSRPLPRAMIERGWLLDEQGREMKIRRSTQACGVDGLEAGQRYRLDVVREKLAKTWWKWGIKDEVLVDNGSLDWNLGPGEQSPLGIEDVEGVEFDVEE